MADTLKLSGSRGTKEVSDSANDRKAYRLQYSEFSKTFTLNDKIDTENIDAQFENGFLKLTLPKSADKKPRSIPLK